MALVTATTIKVALSVAGNKKFWKALLIVTLSVLGLLLAALMLFMTVITGVFAMFADADIERSWNYLKERLEEVFGGLNTSINTDIKDSVYEFMPEFSVNLSKACINSNYDGSYLILYDTAEITEADEYMTAAADALRSATSEDDITVWLDGIDADINLSFSDIENDSIFLTDSGTTRIEDYDAAVREAIFTAAQSQLNKYDYEYEEFTTEDERFATRQTLTVTDGDNVKIVEYICIGGGAIYIPEFMAMYQTFSSATLLEVTLHSGDEVEADIRTVFEEMPTSEDDIEEYIQSAWDGIAGAHSPHNLANLNIFQSTALSKVLGEAMDDGLISVTSDLHTDGNTEKLTITMETPGNDTWREIFGVTEELQPYCNEFERSITRRLDEVGIPEEERTLSLDSMVQAALFCYFEGFFNLPVESTDLKSGTNGIHTVFGQVDNLHQQGMYIGGERGVTLELESANTPIKAELLPVGDCIEETLVYDVWDMEEHEIQKDIVSYVYNYSAVTLAYYINVDTFEQQYGFAFPTIVGANGRTVEPHGGYVTLLVEYSCLDSLNRIGEFDVGSSIDDVYGNDEIILGYCHNGELDNEKDLHTSVTTHFHNINFETVPHVCIKTYFCEGYLNVPEITDPHVYSGLAAENTGTRVNPRLWFKAFRTDLDEELYDTLVAVEVIDD